ncbi:MAG TPA: iron-containing alcohol dehydrogenase, partial [Spirochaetia bacterium]|nr:iron-containing alcohol dehydrogenase [Spirochaetia bacterium]
FDNVQPNPRDRDCEAGGEAARRWGADVIVAVGGGSVLDSAKAIALLQTHGGYIRDFEGRGKVTREVTAVVAIPTTAGTGSEVTRSAVITDTARNFKMTVKDEKLAPILAIVDPETTYSLPAAITASTGMDALIHAIEAFTCRLANPLSDVVALAAMEKIFPSLRTAVHHGTDKEARYDMMVGSLLAGIAFSHADVAAVHCMAEALSGLYDTAHGVANSMFLPVVTAYNAQVDPDRHARVAATCGLPVSGLSEGKAASLLVKELARLAGDIGIPAFVNLSCVNPKDFEHLADSACRNGSTPSNCRDIGKEGYLRLFQESYAQGESF